MEHLFEQFKINLSCSKNYKNIKEKIVEENRESAYILGVMVTKWYLSQSGRDFLIKKSLTFSEKFERYDRIHRNLRHF